MSRYNSIDRAMQPAPGHEPEDHNERTRSTWYINRRGDGFHETVDEALGYEEAERLGIEYAMSDPAGTYTISSTPRPNWKED